MKTKIFGFTLIELMIVLAIAGIVTAVAVTSYSSYIVKTRRAEAQSALLNLAARLEIYYNDHNTYASATIGTGASSDVLTSQTTSNGYYQLSITAQTASSYTISAVPQGAQASEDTGCGTLSYNSLGQKTVSGSKGENACW